MTPRPIGPQVTMLADGSLYDPFDPTTTRKRVFTPDNIARGLAKICRFNGATELFYSVAQHSVLLAQKLLRKCPDDPLLAMHGLLHDAHEIVLGDITTPAQYIMFGQVSYDAIDQISGVKSMIQEHILNELGIPDGPEIRHNLIHECDRGLLATEFRDLMPNPGPDPDRRDAYLAGLPKPWPDRIGPGWSWIHAEIQFQQMYRQIMIAIEHNRIGSGSPPSLDTP